MNEKNFKTVMGALIKDYRNKEADKIGLYEKGKMCNGRLVRETLEMNEYFFTTYYKLTDNNWWIEATIKSFEKEVKRENEKKGPL